MHIPSEMLSGWVCPVSAAVAAAGLGAAFYALSKEKTSPSALRFTLVSAAVFILQMLNYPIWDGVSGHLIGGVLAASLLGIPAAILSMSIVLSVQTLLFADGGILMLGANIINMSLIGAGLGGALRRILLNRKLDDAVSTGIAAFLSVELAAIALCAELYFSDKGSGRVYATLVGSHTALAFVEGAATVLLKSLVGEEKGASARSRAVLAGIVILGLALAPFASSFPDAFEWTVQNFSILPVSSNFSWAPFPEYSVPFGGEYLSVIFAGAVGILAISALSAVALWPLKLRV